MIRCFVLQDPRGYDDRIKFWGNTFGFTCTTELTDGIEQYDVLFFHGTDIDGNIDKLIEHDTARWKIIYSGDPPTPINIDQEKKMIKLVSWEIIQANFGSFVKSVEQKRASNPSYEITIGDIYVLIGYDPLLEAKLELLHMCLTPEGKKKSKSQWDKVLTYYPEDGHAQMKKLYDSIPEAGDCFAENYIMALEKLRNAILSE